MKKQRITKKIFDTKLHARLLTYLVFKAILMLYSHNFPNDIYSLIN